MLESVNVLTTRVMVPVSGAVTTRPAGPARTRTLTRQEKGFGLLTAT
jgi:hypothetical protein